MSPNGFYNGAVVSIDQLENNSSHYEVNQKENFFFFDADPSNGERDGSQIKINYGFGPVTLVGYVDIGAGEIVVNVTVAGISIGTFKGNLNDGISFNVNLLVAKGHIKLYKGEKALYMDMSIKIVFDGEYKKNGLKIVDV